MTVRMNNDKTVVERVADKHDKINCPQAKRDFEEPAPGYILAAIVQQISCQHGHGHRKEQGFHEQYKIHYRARYLNIVGDQFYEREKAAQYEHDKIAQEEALAPTVNPGNDNGEPHTQET